MQKKKLTGYESVYTGYGSVSSGCEFVSGYGFVVWQVSYTETLYVEHKTFNASKGGKWMKE